MDPRAVPDWTGDARALRERQHALADQVRLRDGFTKPLRTVAGLHVGFGDGGATARAVAVLFDAVTLDELESHAASATARMPDVPGLSSFRALPALLAALAGLTVAPDLVLVDGHGIDHPHRLGLAAHVGLAGNLPAIGVADEVLVGATVTALHDMRGAFTTLRDAGRQVGWLLRSEVGSPPLVVSPGHRVAMASAPELVMGFVTTGRLPAPIGHARRHVADPGR